MTLPISVEDVKREVKILDTLSGHENVVQFIASFEDNDLVYIVMELCEGGELLDRILAKKESRYSEKDAARIVRQMLNVAAQCHLNGVVHRDMKPEVGTCTSFTTRAAIMWMRTKESVDYQMHTMSGSLTTKFTE
jgi:calcium-dependent protein kinase